MSSTNGKGGFRGYFEWFVHSEVSGSILLLACAIAALVWANSPWAASYFDILHTYVGLSWGDASFDLSLHHRINDGLIATAKIGIIAASFAWCCSPRWRETSPSSRTMPKP